MSHPPQEAVVPGALIRYPAMHSLGAVHLMVAETKLIRPGLPAHLIEDEQRQALLNHASRFTFTLVCAPAGFGKTTLVSHWLDRNKPPHAWVTLESRDNQPLLFWEVIWNALARVDAHFDAHQPSLINALQNRTDDDPVDRLVNALSDYARTWHAPAHLYLVLDDLQLINDEHLLTDFRRLLDLAPPLLKVIATSRTIPSLRLPQLLARNQARVIDSDMLRFDLPLTRAFLRERLGEELPDSRICTLHERTQGWPAALLLASMVAPGSESQAFSASQGALAGYLMEEVFNQLPRHLQRFLEEIAQLPFFSAKLADAIRKSQDSDLMIEQLKQHNLLLHPLGAQGQFLRLHDLLRDWLLTHDVDDARQRELRHRAAEALADQGMVTEALELFLQDAHWAAAEALLPDALDEWAATGTLQARHNTLEQFPADIRQRSYALGVLEAFMLFFDGRYEQAREKLDRGETKRQQATRPEPENLVAASLLLRCQSARYSGNREKALTLIRQTARSMPAVSTRFQAWAFYTLGTDCMMEADLITSERYLRRALEISTRLGDTLCAVRTLAPLIPVLIHRCQPETARQLFDQTCDAFSDTVKRSEEAALLAYLEEILALESNHVSLANQALQRAFEFGQGCVTPMDRMYFNFEDWRLGMITNDPKRCEQALGRIESEHLYRGGHWSYMIPSLKVLRGLTLLLQGDTAALIEWSQSPEAGGEGVPWRRLHEKAIALKASLITGAIDDQALEELHRLLDEGDNRLVKARLHLLEILRCWYVFDDADTAATQLVKHIDRHYPNGCLRVYLDEGRWLYPVLERGRQLFPDNPNLPGLMRQFSQSQPAPAPEQPPMDEVSSREREVLQLLSSGYTNQQMGEQLGISKATIKAHLRNIYGKLGVTNRTRAVARGRELRLIEQ